MSFTLSTFTKSLSSIFDQIKKDQAEALNIQIAANFVAGMTAGEKHRSFKSADPEPEDPDVDEEGLTTEEKEEIALLIALYLGYISEFNDRAQTQIIEKAKEFITEAGNPKSLDEATIKEIQKYTDAILSGKENVVIDNVGKIRKELYVDKNLKISEVETVITKKYSSSVKNYADLLGERAAHASYEAGRKTYLISQGLQDWIFSGPADERARPHHMILIGERFTWGTDQSSYAERILQEPRCRHRAVPFYNDERDVKKEVWDRLKEEAGIFWNEELNKWDVH